MCWKGDAISGGMVTVDASLVLDTIVAVSIAAGAFFAVIQLREMAKDRRTGLMLRFADIWLTMEFEEIISKLIRSNFTTGEEAEKVIPQAGLVLVGDYFETMSEYARVGLLDPDYMASVYPVEWGWEKLRPWIVYARSSTGLSELHSSFEWLAGEAKKKRQASELKRGST